MTTRWRLPAPVRSRLFAGAFVASVLLHGAALGAAMRWGDCLCHIGKVVCPKLCDTQRLDLELVKTPPPPPPPPPRVEKPKPAPLVLAKPKPKQAPAAPKRGKIVLPDEAFQRPKPRPAEVTAKLPTLPPEVVEKQSEANAPVLANPRIFDRADDLQPGAPGEHGLGGTGEGSDPGSRGTAKTGDSGTGEELRPGPVVAPQAPPPQPKPEPPKRKGPTRSPRVLDWTDPPYPEQARRQGIEGTAALRVQVSVSGRPEQVMVSRSSGRSDFDAVAVSHVKEARFDPALKDGEPVAMTITFRVRFRLVNG